MRSPSRARRTTRWPPATRSKSNACIGWPLTSITKLVMSTTLLIGRMPAADSRAFSHSGDGPMVTSSNSRAVKRGHRSGSSTSIRTPGTSPGRARILAPRRRGERGAGGRVDLARDAVDAEAVGPVGRDLELEHVGGDRQHVGERRAGLERRVEHHDPVVVGADRELVLGEDHPVGLDAAQLGPLEPRAVGHDRPGSCDRDDLAGSHVRGAADDLAHVAVADLDRADREPVGVRVALGAQHAADREVLERVDAVAVDGLDLRAGHRQPVLEVVGAEPGVAVVVEPEDRNPHPNCSRKRRSFS